MTKGIRIEIRPTAREDLLDIVGYIALDNIDAALRVQLELEEGIKGLLNSPSMGVPDVDLSKLTKMNIRKLVISRYSILYAFHEDDACICIYRVIHHKRDIDISKLITDFV